MAAMQTSLAQQHSRSLLRQPVSTSKTFQRKTCLYPTQTRTSHISPRLWHTAPGSSAAATTAAAVSAALPADPESFVSHPLQRLCKNVLVGVAAAAAWSVAASVFGGSSSPLASLTIATNPGASSKSLFLSLSMFMRSQAALQGAGQSLCVLTEI